MQRAQSFGESGWSRGDGLRALGTSILVTLLALGVTFLIADRNGTPVFAFFLLGAVLSAIVAGAIAGLLTTFFVGGVAAWYYWVPLRSVDAVETGNLLRFAGFIVLALAGVMLISQMQSLRRRERLLTAMVNTSPSLIVLTDSAGRILLFNRRCEQLTGYYGNEVIGKELEEVLIPREWQAAVRERIQQVHGAKLAEPHENPWKMKDGRERLIEWRCVPVPGRLGERPYVLSLGIDISEVQATRKKVLEAERMSAQAEVINQLAHELNNPLQALTNTVELLREAGTSESGSSQYLKQFEDAVGRISKVSRSLLTVTARQKASVQSAPGADSDAKPAID